MCSYNSFLLILSNIITCCSIPARFDRGHRQSTVEFKAYENKILDRKTDIINTANVKNNSRLLCRMRHEEAMWEKVLLKGLKLCKLFV